MLGAHVKFVEHVIIYHTDYYSSIDSKHTFSANCKPIITEIIREPYYSLHASHCHIKHIFSFINQTYIIGITSFS